MSQHLELLSGPLHDVKLADVLDRLVDDAYRGLCDVLKGLSQDATDADRYVVLHRTSTTLCIMIIPTQKEKASGVSARHAPAIASPARARAVGTQGPRC